MKLQKSKARSLTVVAILIGSVAGCSETPTDFGPTEGSATAVGWRFVGPKGVKSGATYLAGTVLDFEQSANFTYRAGSAVGGIWQYCSGSPPTWCPIGDTLN